MDNELIANGYATVVVNAISDLFIVVVNAMSNLLK